MSEITESTDEARRRARRRVVTWITFSRAPLVLLAAGLALWHGLRPAVWRLAGVVVCMALSALTDWLDGWLARRWRVVSRFGALADPLMDKVFYVATLPVAVFLALWAGDVEHAALLLALDVVSMLRDQWVSFLRSIGSSYGADVRASWSGKLRTALGFPVIVGIYLLLGLQSAGVPLHAGWRAVLLVAEGVLLGVTVLSAVAYTRQYLPHLRRAMAED